MEDVRSSSLQGSALNAQDCLDDSEDELISDAFDAHADCHNVCSHITAKNLVSFLQKHLEIHKSPSIEKNILMLASEATSDEYKSNFIHEFLQDVSRMVEVCFVEAEVEKNAQKKAIRLEKEFALKRCNSFHHYTNKQSWEKLISYKSEKTEEYMKYIRVVAVVTQLKKKGKVLKAPNYAMKANLAA